jgi:Protein of unknown function (DUF3309)
VVTHSKQEGRSNYIDDPCCDSGVDAGWSVAFLAAQRGYYPSGGLGLILLIVIILLLMGH